MRRSGFTLLELMVVLPVMAAAALIFRQLLTQMVRDVPRQADVASTSGDIQTILARMQRDFDAAGSLPPSLDGQGADETRFWLTTDGRVLRWQVKDGQLSRDEYAAGADRKHLHQTQWPLRQAKLRFERLPDGGAVAVHSAVTYRSMGRAMDKLVNAHVFAISGLPGHREQP
jgi:prepilin-type N-terminal cleavage/methylation domain-containing protein